MQLLVRQFVSECELRILRSWDICIQRCVYTETSNESLEIRIYKMGMYKLLNTFWNIFNFFNKYRHGNIEKQ
jgi:hypothetical protein